MSPDDFRERLAVNTDNIEDLKRESERQRGRIHALESSFHGVRALTKAVDELQQSLPALARRAAKEAVAEDRRARHRAWYANLRTYAAVAGVGVALGALIVGIILGR